MSKRVRLTFALAAAAAVGALLMQACESVPLTAAPGTDLTLIANPTFVIANGGVSVVTAILVEPAGTFAPDGTEVFFFTDLGRVDPSGKSRNGVVRVNFVSDARSGIAHVSAISGAPAPAPAPTTSPSPGSGGGVGASAVTAGPAPRVVAAGDIAGAENFDKVEISVGSELPERVHVTANPSVLVNNRSATIVANVFDVRGNPVQNVPVVFEVSVVGAAPFQEVLESGGVPRHTDANGQAFDTLTTRAPAPPSSGGVQKQVSVLATTATGEFDDVTVTINYSATPTR